MREWWPKLADLGCSAGPIEAGRKRSKEFPDDYTSRGEVGRVIIHWPQPLSLFFACNGSYCDTIKGQYGRKIY